MPHEAEGDDGTAEASKVTGASQRCSRGAARVAGGADGGEEADGTTGAGAVETVA